MKKILVQNLNDSKELNEEFNDSNISQVHETRNSSVLKNVYQVAPRNKRDSISPSRIIAQSYAPKEPYLPKPLSTTK